MAEIDIKEALANATFAPNRALSSEVTAINLGDFHKSATELFTKSITEKYAGEPALAVIVNAEKNVRISKEPFVLGKYDLRKWLEISTSESGVTKENRQKWFIGTVMKTSNEGRPFNLEDLYNLALPDSNPEAYTALYAVSLNTHNLIFRGPQAWTMPELLQETVRPHVKGADDFLTQMWEGSKQSKKNFQDMIDKFRRTPDLGSMIGDIFNTGMKRDDMREGEERTNKDNFLKGCQWAGYRVFTCPANERVAKLYQG